MKVWGRWVGDLDIPGRVRQQGSEDEENNYYSIGGDTMI
jgi:hypothetical protein